MTLFDRPIGPDSYAAIRFGVGKPAGNAPRTPEAMIDRLRGPDRMAQAFPMVSFDEVAQGGIAYREARQMQAQSMEGAGAEVKQRRNWINIAYEQSLINELSRCLETDDPFRERLFRFWTTHFATRSRSVHLTAGAPAYNDEALRPHITGRFGDLLKSAVTHPFMLIYLDQAGSIGPNSPIGKTRGKGLNENLAREILELHTLGVGAPYTQQDVTQLAELLTGVQFTFKQGFAFRPALAEPGAETVLGRSYGGDGKASLDDVHAALDDIAVHPSTAAHISRKLAVHFVADDPDPGLVAAMTAAFTDTGGDLMAVYAAMLGHPAAWTGFGAKVKTPMDFMTSSMVALGLGARDLQLLKRRQVRKSLLEALKTMGQEYQRPPGPDGWPEAPGAWIHPQGLAARIGWAMGLARLVPGGPPDPRAFVDAVLGDAASGRLIWAAGAAETRAEGVGVVLASAEFNRR